MKKTGAQHVLFADVVQKINRQGKAQPRVLLLTERSLHTLTPGKFKQGNCVPLGDVTKLSMSTYADGYMVVHVKEGAKDCKADLLFESMRKAEIATAISETEALGPDFTFAFADEIAFRSKASDLLGDSKVVARTITFAEDASLKTLGAVAVLSFDKKKPEVIAVGCAPALGSEAPLQLDKLRTPAPIAGGGEAWKPPPPLLAKGSAPAVMGARPPLVPPRAGGLVRRRSFSSFPAARVLHNFAARGGEELTLNKGSMVRVLEQKDPSGGMASTTARWGCSRRTTSSCCRRAGVDFVKYHGAIHGFDISAAADVAPPLAHELARCNLAERVRRITMPGRGGRGSGRGRGRGQPASEADANEPPQHRVIYNADLWEKVLDFLPLPDAARLAGLCQDHWALRAAASRAATGLDLCFRTNKAGAVWLIIGEYSGTPRIRPGVTGGGVPPPQMRMRRRRRHDDAEREGGDDGPAVPAGNMVGEVADWLEVHVVTLCTR